MYRKARLWEAALRIAEDYLPAKVSYYWLQSQLLISFYWMVVLSAGYAMLLYLMAATELRNHNMVVILSSAQGQLTSAILRLCSGCRLRRLLL